MDLGLTGKLALVSGSTAGIGYAIAEALVREGARVIVNGRTPQSVDAAIAKLNGLAAGSALPFIADLSTAASAGDVARQFPDVEIVVNNLGIFEPKDFVEITDEEWLRFFEVNVLSGIRLARRLRREPAFFGDNRSRPESRWRRGEERRINPKPQGSNPKSQVQELGIWSLGLGIWDLGGRRSLCIHIDRIQRLARAHEQPVALRPAERDVRADLGEADAANQLPLRIPDRDAVIAKLAARVASRPQVAVHVHAGPVGSALHAVDHEIAELRRPAKLVVRVDVERVHAAIAAAPRVAGELREADDIELPAIG